MKAYLLIAYLILLGVIGTAWCFNLYKLTKCDFAAPYKGEVLHAVGLFPPAAVVMVWFDDK